MKTIVHSSGIQTNGWKPAILCLISLIIAALISAVYAGPPPPLIYNGGFENGFDGWQTGGNVAVKSAAPYVPAMGEKLAAFNSGNTSSNGYVAQTAATSTGATYRLHFAVGTLSYTSASQRLDVSVAGNATLLSQILTIKGAAGGKTIWSNRTLLFVADSESTTLRFRDLSKVTNGIDLLLDNVVVEKVHLLELRAETNLPYPVEIAADPPDWDGKAGGPTPFVRRYENGTVVKLTAPASYMVIGGGPSRGILPRRTYRFQHWVVRDEIYDTSNEIFQTYADQKFTAVYEPGPPIITGQPQDLSVPLGGSATFRVAVDAPGTFYQWWFNGQPLDNTNSETFTIPSVSAADAGTYHVVCGDLGGSVTSAPAILRVIAPPFGNGGFENGSEGWTATGNVRFISSPIYPPTEGKAVANFNAGDREPNGVLSQTFLTVPWRSYLLTMDAGILSYIRQWQKMEIHISGAQAGPWQFSEPGSGAGKVEWHPLAIPFIAHEDLTVIEFRDTSDTSRSIDLLLDNVRLLEVPPGYVLVAPGTFAMGSPVNEPGRGMFEQSHSVSLTNYLIAKATEVTWAEWVSTRSQAQSRGYTDLAAGRNGLNGRPLGDHPVTEVSWWDAIKWCNLKSEMDGLVPAYYSAPSLAASSVLRRGMPTPHVNWNANGYRLPTESEWEYFCRAGSTTAFFNGQASPNSGSLVDSTLDLSGWYAENSGGNTQPVAMKIPSPWGLYDTHGGVFEWCWDWLGFYPAGPSVNPTGAATGSDRVIRGGGWNVESRQCRSAFRHSAFPIHRFDFVGFRPVRTASQ